MKLLYACILAALPGLAFAGQTSADAQACQRLNARISLDETALAGAVNAKNYGRTLQDLNFSQSLSTGFCAVGAIPNKRKTSP